MVSGGLSYLKNITPAPLRRLARLALRGSKTEFYRTPPAPHVLIHDWLWRRCGQGIIVSWLLLKRLNVAKQ